VPGGIREAMLIAAFVAFVASLALAVAQVRPVPLSILPGYCRPRGIQLMCRAPRTGRPWYPQCRWTTQCARQFACSTPGHGGRFYDLANCLDGLTFGFGNWPQPEIGDFFRMQSFVPKGVAFYQDNKDWLVPVWSRAGREPAIVAFQVAYGIGTFSSPLSRMPRPLVLSQMECSSWHSMSPNPGQVPDLRDVAQLPPLTLGAGGRQWRWARPPQHLNVDLDTCHNLLLWQAMCPVGGRKFKIRSRNAAYFNQYLAPTFQLPVENHGIPDEYHRSNCHPDQVTLRIE
jgi:hypothetical protein